MRQHSHCPAPAALADYAHNRAESGDIEAHVRGCSSCQAEVEREVSRSASGPRASERERTVSMPTETRPAPVELARGLNLGRYVLLDKLGEGGMGVVYAAYDSTLDRKVALKFLRESQGGKRLLREAQVMARVSHPNIVALFDASTFQDRVFVSMEYIDGVDLRVWLSQAARSWDQVLGVMQKAARGLVALHAAGLIHRDFKPENVLVGNDGAVKVTDFGLTRPAEAMLDEDAELLDAPDSLVHARLTRRGRLVGTPEYMAPELVSGKPADALSDQFAFAVTLFEALYGMAAFEERSETRWTKKTWTVRSIPEKTQVPAWVGRTILRGLSVAPEQRFASMDAMLGALSDDPRKRVRRRLWLGASVTGVVGSAALAGFLFVESQNRMCEGAERKLTGIWDAPRKRAVTSALHATGVPYASVTAERVGQALDSYAAKWVSLHTEACEATRRRGEHSEEILERRMTCLDRRLRELDALTDELARADAPVVERAALASNQLFDASTCLDPDANRFAYDAPRDAATRAKTEAVRKGLDRARALDALGKPKEALPLAQEGRRQAEQVPYAPLRAEALATLGLIQSHMMDKAAEDTLLEAVRTAEAAHHDELAAMAWTWLVRAAWDASGHHEAAHRWAEFAEAAIRRLGGSPAMEGRLHNHVGSLLWREGKHDQALATYTRARELLAREFGEGHEETGRVDNNIGLVHAFRGEVDLAIQHYQRAMQASINTLGPEHPRVASALHNIGIGLIEQRKLGEAIDTLSRALALEEKLLGPEHPTVASTLNQLGSAYRESGDTDRALGLHRKARAMREKALGREHTDVALTLLFEGETLNRAGRYDEAQPVLEEARAIFEQKLGKEHSDVADALTRIGEAHLRRGRVREAAEQLERALAIRAKQRGDTVYLALNEFLLAQALAGTPGHAARAHELARSSIAHYRSVGPYRAKEAAQVEGWLAQQPATAAL